MKRIGWEKSAVIAAGIAAIACASLIAACSGGGGGGDNGPVGPGSMMGRIRDLSDNEVTAATVRVGGVPVEVNEQGWFFATDLDDSDRLAVEITSPGFVSVQRYVAIRQGRNSFLDVRLFPRATPVSVDGSVGGTVAAGSGGLMIPSGALRNAAGVPFTGSANVSVTLLDPSSREGRLAAPAFMGIPTGATAAVPFESFGMLNVSADDGAGGPLTIGSGSVLTFTLPTGAGTPPASVPLWNFDASSGAWVEAGTATFDSGSGRYSTTVTTTATMTSSGGMSTYWNADQPYATACVTGRVVNPDGEPAVGGIEVNSEGTSYVGSSTAYTSDDGRFQVDVKASATGAPSAAQVYAQGGGLYTEIPIVVSPTPEELASTGNCTDIGDVVLAYPLASMVLTWGATPSDLDTHFTGPDGTGLRFEVYFSNQSVPEATLDTDDTSSYGPEVTSLLRATPGTYVYTVHNYSGEGGGPIKASGAKIRAFFPEGAREFDVSTASGDSTDATAVWRVFSFEIGSGGNIGRLREINEVVNDTPDAYQP